jgi:poly-gamma-glutamate synthesis protein (capsule biosynthesis protein)
MTVTIGLAGDTMLGRGVADRLAGTRPAPPFAQGVRDVVGRADLFFTNLECCVSTRGVRVDLPGKPFFFRAPPRAARVLAALGVDIVSLANNHALDFGAEALLDTRKLLACAGIDAVGAGRDVGEARTPAMLRADGLRIAVIACTDHPADYAAGPDRPGVAYADLSSGVPDWLREEIADAREKADVVFVSPHWGPNMAPVPQPYIQRAAAELVEAGATVVAGHSAHVFQGVAGRVLFDLGDFVDDYAADPALRNDLGLMFLVALDEDGPRRLEAVPIAPDYCHTRLADTDEYRWVRDRFTDLCARMGTEVADAGGHLEIHWT